MREIEFRAKKDKSNNWVYGYYHRLNESFENKDCILEHHRNTSLIIDGNTLGQYTGLKDKNGTKIFEGDIIKVNGESYTEQWKDIGVVEYFKGAFGVSYENGKHFLAFNNMSMYVRGYEVIGNIYDNPELLN